MTPNQLYYLLSRCDELGVNTGPTNVRLENLLAEPTTPSNYVSFLAQSHHLKIRSYDADSIHSVTSVRSLVSSMSHALSNITFPGSSAAKRAKQQAAAQDDVRYLYSAFTKVPCLKISVDHRLRRIAGFEEFPFDTAVPITIFKNLTAFEVADIDFRSVFGWNFLAENLHSLTLKRACLDDLSELLNDIVLDDMDQRRRRSSKNAHSPGFSLATPSTVSKSLAFPASMSPAFATPKTNRPKSSEGTDGKRTNYKNDTKLSRSTSPKKTPMRRKDSIYSRSQNIGRRSSASSTSSTRFHSPRQSSTSLTLNLLLPSHKWRFLRHLSVPDNGLTAISAESLVPLVDTLESLDLSSNLFKEVPEALSTLVALRALNLTNCLIESIRTLGRSPLPAITVLNLRGNRLNSLAGIQSLKSLQRLDIRENALTDPAEIARLTGMPEFYDVFVNRNPFTKTHARYRITIFNLFRVSPGYLEDVRIDGSLPERGERRQLADRPPETVRDVTTDFVDTVELAAALSTNSQDVQNLGQVAPSAEPHTPHLKSKQRRRKGPKRRTVEVTDQENSRTKDSDTDTQDGTVFKTAFENPHARFERETQKAGVSPARQNRGISENLQENTSISPTQQTAEALKSSGSSVSRDVERAPFPRSISQSNDHYNKRIESLKRGRGDIWTEAAVKTTDLLSEPPRSPMVKVQTSPVLTPFQVTNRTPINI